MNLTKFLIFGAVLFSSVTFNYGQTDNSFPIKKFGAGIQLEHYKLIDQDIIFGGPVNKIVFTFNPISRFRIEPGFGFQFFKDKRDSLNTNEFSAGLGLFWMKQYNRLNVYAGIRAEYDIYIDDMSPIGSVNRKDKRFLYKFGPTVGGEFFLTDRLSIGGEIGARYAYYVYTRDPRPEGYSDSRSKYFASDNSLLIRFYF